MTYKNRLARTIQRTEQTAKERIARMLVGDTIHVSTGVQDVWRRAAAECGVRVRFDTGRGHTTRMIRLP